jgi:hypothetical protein
MIKGFLVTILAVLLSIHQANAFLPECNVRYLPPPNVIKSSSDLSPLVNQPLTHDEIIWKLRPPPETSLSKRIFLKLGANAIRLECKIRGVDAPFCLCPKGGQAVLEAYYQGMYI